MLLNIVTYLIKKYLFVNGNGKEANLEGCGKITVETALCSNKVVDCVLVQCLVIYLQIGDLRQLSTNYSRNYQYGAAEWRKSEIRRN